ncbi:MAG TPA: DUF4262 domain-containing protein [Chryseolinea sp.]
MSELSKRDQKVLDDIDAFGWHVVKVRPDEEGPGFVYSIGLYKTFGHPEIIIIGLELDLAHALINDIGEDIRQDKLYRSGEFYNNLLDGFDCLMLAVPKESYEAYVGYARWYYKGNDFLLMQCIYPTVQGVFPWAKEWPEDMIAVQPVLGDIHDIENIDI